jgi:hypothetical protein
MKKTVFAILVASLMVLITFSALSGGANSISTTDVDERGSLKVKITSITYRPDGASQSVSLEGMTVRVAVEQNNLEILSGTTTAPHKLLGGITFNNLYIGHEYTVKATIDSWISPVDGKEYTFSGSTKVETKDNFLNTPTKCSLTMTGRLKPKAKNLDPLPVNLQQIVTFLRAFFSNRAGILTL